MYQTIHPTVNFVLLVSIHIADVGTKTFDFVPHDIQHEGIELEKFRGYGPCEVVVLESDGDGLSLGTIECVKKVVWNGTSKVISVEANL